MHVRIDETGHQRGPADVDRFRCFTPTPTRDHAVGDGEIGGDPFAGDGREHPTAGDQEIGRFVTTGNGQGSERGGRSRHGEMIIHLDESGETPG